MLNPESPNYRLRDQQPPTIRVDPITGTVYRARPASEVLDTANRSWWPKNRSPKNPRGNRG